MATNEQSRTDFIDLSGKVALVTASGRNIGRATVLELARRGADVVVNARTNQAEAESVAEEARNLGVKALPVLADVGSQEQVIRMVESALSEFGRLDILVNNAAIFYNKPIPKFTVEEFDHTIAVNLRANFFLSKGFVEGMAAGGWGRIINISSVGARTGGVSQSAVYNATKAAMISLTKNFARNYGAFGVNVNAVAPGFVDSFMTSHVPEDEKQAYLSQIPLGRAAQPRDIANVVVFLAGDESSYITGATIDVNGGWVMT